VEHYYEIYITQIPQDRAVANIEVYLTNPAGIGEHPDIVEAIDTELAKLAEADEKLKTLNEYFAG